jgi:UDP-N-acetylmuramyl tripeptide synthase
MLAVWIGKMVALACRIIGKEGSTLPGFVARKFYSRVLKDLSQRLRKPRLTYLEGKGYKNIPGRIIAVTGTNGKTTVAHLVSDYLKVSGQKIIYNQQGANMISGVTTAFIARAKLSGKISCEFAILEIDEGSLPGVMEEVGLDILVVTNFYNDQEDRYNSEGSAAEIVKAALEKDENVWLVLNADDPNAAGLADVMPQQSFFYGMLGGAKTLEAHICPRCSGMLEDIGDYACKCGFARPAPDLTVVEAAKPSARGLRCRVRLSTGEEHTLALPAQGFFNYYNMAAAFLTGICLGLKPERMTAGFKMYQPSPGRMEQFAYKGKSVLLNLVKNAKGYSETLALLEQMSGRIVVLMALNDHMADGHDVSWIWDVDFEKISPGVGDKYVGFVCTGLRAAEMAVRLKYAGIVQDRIAVMDDMPAAAQIALESPGDHTVMLSSYSSLSSLRTILLTMVSKQKGVREGGSAC